MKLKYTKKLNAPFIRVYKNQNNDTIAKTEITPDRMHIKHSLKIHVDKEIAHKILSYNLN